MTPQEQAFREIDRDVASLDRLIDEIEHYNWQKRLEADPEAKAIYDAMRDSFEQQATDNFVERTATRRYYRSQAIRRYLNGGLSELEMRALDGDR